MYCPKIPQTDIWDWDTERACFFWSGCDFLAEETKKCALESLVAGLLETIYNAPEEIPKLSASIQGRGFLCAN
jgi:hypothetical protein